MSFNIQGRITSVLDELTKAERKIGQYILSYPEQVITMTASDLAVAAGTSSATVIRFCKKIDVSSYPELKVNLAPEIDRPRMVGYSDIAESESIEEIKSKLLGNAYQSMLETVEQLNHESIETLVDLLIHADTLFVYGVGASNLVAENIMHKWGRLGKTVIHLEDPHILIPIMTSAKGKVVFWGISNSGETSEVIDLTQIAKKNELTTVSLTQFGSNTLSNLSEVSIQTVKANEAILRSAATSSLHAQFMIVDIVFLLFASRNYDQNMAAIKKSRLDIEKFNQGV